MGYKMDGKGEGGPAFAAGRSASGGRLTKIFDPADQFAPLADVWAVTDATVALRGDQWWMFLAGKVAGHEGIQLMSATLGAGEKLSASGWKLKASAEDAGKVDTVAGHERSASWDLKGGRHGPAYARGLDPARGEWVERIYYAGGAESNWGPYTIGYLEWDGERWIDQASPVFAATEEWEHGSVYEPNVIYADGQWKMWYVAGSNQEDYLVQGYAESEDGRTNWSGRQIVVGPEDKVFDFCVTPVDGGYEAVFAKVWVAKTPRPEGTGLWWCRAKNSSAPSPMMADWSEPVLILPADEQSWFGGPWKPCLRYDERVPETMFVFFDGIYSKPEAVGFPLVFTLGCLELATGRGG